MRTTTQLGIAAVLMLICLRLMIGWHFFKEGMKKYNNPGFSSAMFLREAKGPLAKLSHKMAHEGFHDWDGLMAVPQKDDAAATAAKIKKLGKASSQDLLAVAPYKDWAEQVKRDWKSMLQSLIDAAQMDEDQRTGAAASYDRRAQQLTDYLAEQYDDIITYQHELYRLGEMESGQIASDVPFQKDRIARKRVELAQSAAPWKTSVRSFEEGFMADLRSRLSDQQRELARASEKKNPIDRVNVFVTYFLIVLGACLIVGLFTRTAAFGAALFLLSVVVLQPPWVAGAAPTYNQWVELFAALVVGTTHVGKWGGLDYFISAMLGRCCCGKCGTQSK